MNNFLRSFFNRDSFIIIILLFIGLFLRINSLGNQKIVFGYDQARDAFIADQIAHGDLKILGPPVSLGGFFHGVFYYYFISLPYFFSKGNPIIPIIFISVFNLAAIPLVFLIGKKFFNRQVGILAAVFYTISFDIIQYSNWLSNPALAVPCSVLLFYGLLLFLFTPKKNLGSFLTAIGYGLCFQSQFFLGYLIVPIIFSLVFFKIKPSKKQFFIFTLTSFIVLSTMILAYFKFGFTFINGIKNMSSGNDKFGFLAADFSYSFKTVVVRLVENFYRVVFPFNSFFTFIFVSFCFYFYLKKYPKTSKFYKPLTLFWIFILSQSLILPFGGDSTHHINVGFQLPAIIITSVFLSELFVVHKSISVCLSLILFTSLIYTDINLNPQGSLLFSIQRELTLKNETEAVDYTYKDSQGQPFSINTITSPYWINTLWSYIYQWYGQNKYGYLPQFHGRDQSGQLGSLPSVSNKDKYFYLIIEPTTGIPQSLIDDSIAYENSFSKIIEVQNFNGILIQKRELIKPFDQINFIK